MKKLKRFEKDWLELKVCEKDLAGELEFFTAEMERIKKPENSDKIGIGYQKAVERWQKVTQSRLTKVREQLPQIEKKLEDDSIDRIKENLSLKQTETEQKLVSCENALKLLHERAPSVLDFSFNESEVGKNAIIALYSRMQDNLNGDLLEIKRQTNAIGESGLPNKNIESVSKRKK